MMHTLKSAWLSLADTNVARVAQRALISEKGHCPCESAAFACFHLQFQYFIYLHRPIPLLSANICETRRPNACFIFLIKDEGGVTET